MGIIKSTDPQYLFCNFKLQYALLGILKLQEWIRQAITSTLLNCTIVNATQNSIDTILVYKYKLSTRWSVIRIRYLIPCISPWHDLHSLPLKAQKTYHPSQSCVRCLRYSLFACFTHVVLYCAGLVRHFLNFYFLLAPFFLLSSFLRLSLPLPFLYSIYICYPLS